MDDEAAPKQRWRPRAVSILMIVGFGASLLLAASVVTQRTVRLVRVTAGPLTFAIGDNWQSQPASDAPQHGLMHVLGRFTEPKTGRQLLVGELLNTAVRSASGALQRELAALLPPGDTASLQPIRIGRMVGLRFARVVAVNNTPMLHLIALVSEDARHYFVIWLSQPTRLDAHAYLEARRLHDTILAPLTSSQYQPASAAQRRDVGLRETGPVVSDDRDVEVVTPADLASSTVLTLVPASGAADIAQMRISIDLDMAGFDATFYAPKVLLAQMFSLVMNRPPRDEELRPIKIRGLAGWRVIFQHRATPLIREIWYLPLPDGRAALIEVLGGRKGSRRAISWLDPVLGQLIQNRTQAAPTPDAGRAAADGKRIALGIGNNFKRTHQPQLHYAVIEQHGRLLACEIARVTPPRRSSGRPLRGWSRNIRLRNKVGEVTYQWQSTDDTNDFLMRRYHPLQLTDGRTAMQVVQMQRTHDALKISAGNASTQSATVRLTQAYIPPMNEEDWPMAQLHRLGDSAAIVWMSQGMRFAYPFWLRVLEDQAGDTIVLLRPMLSIDSDRLTLNAKGHVTRRVLQVREGHPAGPAQYTVRAVDRQTLIDRVASDKFTQVLDQLEKEPASHGALD